MDTDPPLAPGPLSEAVYDRRFWLAYVANAALVTGNALTFRFAELVSWLGGSERVAGEIVSLGLLVAVAARLSLSHVIDHYGVRRLWIFTSLLYIAGSTLFLLTTRLSWDIYAARVLFAVGLTGMFACSITHIQNGVPPHRRTEIIGNLGSSGFIGMVLGAQLGDAVFRAIPAGRWQFLALFGGTVVAGVLYLVLVIVLTWRDRHTQPEETPSAVRLLWRHWPGAVVVVALMMGLGITVTTVFLTRFATERGIRGIGTFFAAYAASAFFFRLSAQNWSRTIGRHRMLVRGLLGHAVGHALLPFVTHDWHFLLPAFACGFGHALLFPAVVSLGAGAFPRHYRGAGTAIILAFTDLGVILFAPLLGGIIVRAGFTAMFCTSAGTAFTVAVIYALTIARRPDHDADERPQEVIVPIPQPSMASATARVPVSSRTQ